MPGNGKVYVANFDTGVISVVDPVSQTSLFAFGTAAGPVSLAVNPALTRLYVANATNQSISVHDITNPNTPPLFLAIVATAGVPQDVLVTPNGTHLALALANGNVAVYNTADPPAILATVPVGGTPSRLAASPDSMKVYVANISACAPILDVPTLSAPTCIYTIANNRGVAVSPDGTRVYVTRDTDKVGAYTADGTVFLGQATVGQYPTGVGVTPDGSKLYVANTGLSGTGNTVTVVTASTMTPTNTITLQTGSVGPLGLAHFLDDPEKPCVGTCRLKDIICRGSTIYGLSINTTVPPWSTANLDLCTIADICPCAQPLGRVNWLTGTDYKNCVKDTAQEFQNLGLITSTQRTTINNAIGNSICGTF